MTTHRRCLARLAALAVAGGLLFLVSRVCPQGWGCYAESHCFGYREHWREHARVMKAAGMNTFAIDWKSHDDLRDLIDTAIEEGVIDGSVPVFLMYCGDTAFPALPDDVREGAKAYQTNYIPGHGHGQWRMQAALIALAKAGAKYPRQWPEFVGYNIDEPGRGEPMTPTDIEVIGQVTKGWNEAGLRSGTAVIHPNVENLIGALDILCVAAINGGGLRTSRDAISEAGREFWVYDTTLRVYPPSMSRYHSGYWFWATGAKVHLSWAWYEFQRDGVEREGWQTNPMMTDRLRAYRAGVEDYRRLEAMSPAEQLERRAAFDWEGFPPGALAESKERTGEIYNAEPGFDFERLVPR